MKDKNGITLIALIITIIVMLILVAVTISMAVNGGLFGYAGNAAKDTKTEMEKETRLENVPGNLSTDDLVDYYTRGEVVIETFIWKGAAGSDTNDEVQFEQGMTWKEWINSSYNTYGVGINAFEINNGIYQGQQVEMPTFHGFNVYDESTDGIVFGDSTIVPGRAYFHYND